MDDVGLAGKVGWNRRRQAAARAAVVAICAASTVLTGPFGAAHADSEPPALPAVSGRCTGPSPVRLASVPWAVARLAPEQVWLLTKGSGVTVAVLDTGVSAAAPALAGAVLPGRDVVSGGTADSDCPGRGSALAGVVAARPVSGTGVVGVAPSVTVLPIRIVDRQGRVPAAALASGLRAATAMGARVILLGTGIAADDADLRAAVDEAIGRDVVVVAAVNDRSEAGSGGAPAVWYPAAYPSVVAVNGVDADGMPIVAAASAAGVDLVAPGADAVTVGPSGPGHYRVGGTAVAAAYVAGVAALVRSYRPQLTQAEVRQRLELTAERPPALVPTLGAGTVDAYAAVAAVDPAQARRFSGQPSAVDMPVAAPADPAVARSGWIAAAIAAATVLALLVARAIGGVRRRRWPVR
ncbi:S8 family serine peptidase [Dactylosporangium sp. NPDC005572]|uniref:S8 family serine peptidase n=1 Tax=Dactylosporangium sp. NPDC005572 TaxID=3156889 RepID=UPI0033B62252